MSNSNETSNEPILYELLEYFVRKQEPELIVSGSLICTDAMPYHTHQRIYFINI